MCQRTTPVLALVLGLSLNSATEGQEQHQTVTKIIRKINNEDGLSLGAGVSLATIAPAFDSPFKDIIRSQEKLENQASSVEVKMVTTSRSLDDETGVNVEAKARYLFMEAKARAESVRRSSISEESFRLVIIGKGQYGDDVLRDPKLKNGALVLIKAGKMDTFSRLYGTHYVLREHRIASIYLTISVDRWSDNTLQLLRASLQGGVSLPLAAGELKASIQKDLKEAGNHKTLNVEVTTVGGPVLQGFGDIVKALLTNSKDFQESVGEAVSSMLKSFARDNSGIGAVTVSSYEVFGWEPKKVNLWSKLFEDKLQECAERYYAGRQVERNIRRFAIPNTNVPLQTKLEGYAIQYDSYLRELAKFQQRLLEKDQGFVKKDFPKEPKIDSDTAKDLLPRFKTLESAIHQLERSALHYGVLRVQNPDKKAVDLIDSFVVGRGLDKKFMINGEALKKKGFELPVGVTVVAVWPETIHGNPADITPMLLSGKANKITLDADSPPNRTATIRIRVHYLYTE